VLAVRHRAARLAILDMRTGPTAGGGPSLAGTSYRYRHWRAHAPRTRRTGPVVTPSRRGAPTSRTRSSYAATAVC